MKTRQMWTADREAGNLIEPISSYTEGVELIRQYEEADKADGSFTPDFYEIEYEDDDGAHFRIDGVTKSWKIYGEDGQSSVSECWNLSEPGKARVIEIEHSDKTGTNDYVIVRITRSSAPECKEELEAQLSGGLLKNYRCGRIEEV